MKREVAYLGVSMLLMVFTVFFGVGANLGLTEGSHAEINEEIASAMATDASGSIAVPVVKPGVEYVSGPIAHAVHSWSFVPVVAWQSIGVLLTVAGMLIAGYTGQRVIAHG